MISDEKELVKAGCVVVDSEQRVLLAIAGNRTSWSLPKGHIEPGETALEAAVRETKEETGYSVEAIRELSPLAYRHGETGQPIQVRLWQARVLRHEDEAEERYGWFNLEELREKAYPSIAKYLGNIWAELVIK